MNSLEQFVADLQSSGIGTDLVQGWDAEGEWRVGIRLRSFGRNLPKNRMVLAAGATYYEAMVAALGKAEEGRWESVDYAARPWETRPGLLGQHTYGLRDAL